MNVRRLASRAFAAPPALLLRRGVGAIIVVCGTWLLLRQLLPLGASASPAMQDAWHGGLLAASATALGTLPVLLSHRISQRTSDTLLGFGAGVMLAATVFSLIVPALGAAQSQGWGRWTAGLIVAAGIGLGGLALLLADRLLPGHGVLVGPAVSEDAARALRRAWIFVGAITLHNLPEGLAIGVAFAGVDPAQARALAAGISIQDVPEGLVVALALRSVGHGRLSAVAVGMASGLIEPVAAVLGAAVVSVAVGLLPWGLAFAAGAMLYAVSHEAIPGSHLQGNSRYATAALLVGFVLMMLLDTALSPA